MRNWEIELERIVVVGNTIEEAITNTYTHLSDKFSEGELPVILSVKPTELPIDFINEVQNDNTI